MKYNKGICNHIQDKNLTGQEDFLVFEGTGSKV